MALEAGNVKYDEEFVLNSRGLKLFTCQWIPVNQQTKALIFICHGYAMECSITMNSTANRLAREGFAVYGIDYEGHGKSSGLQGYVESMDNVIEDCAKHFTNICEKKENRGQMRYLLGESMGGAVALLLHRKQRDFWDGAVLVAPMCKVLHILGSYDLARWRICSLSLPQGQKKLADDVKPHPLVINVLTKLCKFIPTWRIIPSKDIIDVAFKVPQVREQIRANKYCYKGRPRLKTGYELLRTTLDIEHNLQEVSLSFIVLHGEEDKVTDNSVSKQLYDVASSRDKTIKLYPEMWHGLLYGEPVENSDRVFKDIIEWLDKRCSHGNTRLERELKQRNDDLSKQRN